MKIRTPATSPIHRTPMIGVRKTLTLMFSFFAMLLWADLLSAQLQQDVRDVFEGMIEDLDQDIQARFKIALKQNTPTVEFTPEQFRRFRRDPSNPFEGLDHINAGDSDGNILLRFELPSMRDRVISPMERQNPMLLKRIAEPLTETAASTVRVFGDERQVAMGTIVGAKGLVLTKASEVDGRESLRCELPNGSRLDAKIVSLNQKNDIALLQIKARGLTPIRWSEKQLLPGAFVLTPDSDGSAIALGTYSVLPRSTIVGEQAYLGVLPETTALGVRISDIRPGTASFHAGLKNGDVLTRLGNVAIFDVATLVKTIRDRRPGDQVEIEFLRKGSKEKVNAVLSGRNVSGERAARFKMMNRLGAVPSRRDGNFPNVFQHDSPLFPEQCGGPITDLDGNAVGINIARRGRAASYAIPANHLQALLKGLLRDQTASPK